MPIVQLSRPRLLGRREVQQQALLQTCKYGELKPRSEVEDLLVNRKTQKFALDDLTDVRTSVPATITGGSLPNSLDLSSDQGFDFGNDNVPGTSAAFTTAQLQNFMEVPDSVAAVDVCTYVRDLQQGLLNAHAAPTTTEEAVRSR